jgi:O-antigen ligase
VASTIQAGTFAPARPHDSEAIASFLSGAAITVLLSVCVLAPVVNFTGSLPWLRAEQLALLPICAVYAWLLFAGLARLVRFNALFVIAPIYCACILLSLFFGTYFLGHAFLYRDLYELPKALFPIAFFTLGVEARLSEVWIRRSLALYSVAIFLVCLYAWAQWMDLGISHQLSLVYSGGAHDDGALAHYRRVYSTMGNPNVLGQLMTWSISAFTLALIFGVGSRLRNVVMVSCCLITLAMTGSRYGLLDTGLAFLLIFLLSFSVRERRRTLVLLLLALLPFFVAIVTVVARSNQATLDRFQTLSDPLQTDSLRGRLDELWPDASVAFTASPIVGNGSAKAIFTGIVTDSEYLDVLKEFGIIGFLAYFAYFIYPLRLLCRGIRNTGRSDLSGETHFPAAIAALQLSFVMLITAVVMNVGMSTFYSEPLQGFFWLWMGIGVSIVRPDALPVRP